MGEDFFSHWAFFDERDPTWGTVDYVSHGRAVELGLVNATSDRVYMGAEQRHKAIGGRGRPSVRIESHAIYNAGLFVVTLDHVPTGCGTWPAFWMYGQDVEHLWPAWGEYDIVEGVHNMSKVLTTLHTNAGCDQSCLMPGRDFNGTWQHGVWKRADNCFIYAEGQWEKQGCSQTGPDASMGEDFNQRGGGTYAAEWDPKAGHIRTWFWPAGAEPRDVREHKPDPSSWGAPYSYFKLDDANCPTDHFKNMRLVFDLTFCGELGNSWYERQCPDLAAKMPCEELVRNHPELMSEAYWSIRALDVYQDPDVTSHLKLKEVPHTEKYEKRHSQRYKPTQQPKHEHREEPKREHIFGSESRQEPRHEDKPRREPGRKPQPGSWQTLGQQGYGQVHFFSSSSQEVSESHLRQQPNKSESGHEPPRQPANETSNSSRPVGEPMQEPPLRPVSGPLDEPLRKPAHGPANETRHELRPKQEPSHMNMHSPPNESRQEPSEHPTSQSAKASREAGHGKAEQEKRHGLRPKEAQSPKYDDKDYAKAGRHDKRQSKADAENRRKTEDARPNGSRVEQQVGAGKEKRHAIHNFYRKDENAGFWGGTCTCPDGQLYEVGDNNDGCKSLACVGGEAGDCKKDGIQAVNHGMKVTCAPNVSAEDLKAYEAEVRHQFKVAGLQCNVGQSVFCFGSGVNCSGAQCCPDGSVCPSASADFTDCPGGKKFADCLSPMLRVAWLRANRSVPARGPDAVFLHQFSNSVYQASQLQRHSKRVLWRVWLATVALAVAAGSAMFVAAARRTRHGEAARVLLPRAGGGQRVQASENIPMLGRS